MVGQKKTELHEIKHHTEGIESDTRSSGAYFRVYLPDRIAEIVLEKGSLDDDSYLIIEKKDDDPPYLRAVEAVNGEDSDLSSDQELRKITTHGSTRLQVNIPADWSDYFVDYNNETEEAENKLVVEVNDYETPHHLRIYRNKEYFTHRIPELAEQEEIDPSSGERAVIPLLGGVLSRLSRGYTDLAADTPFEGQKFQIIPFDGLDDIWLHEDTKSWPEETCHPARIFGDIWREQGLPTRRVKKLTIYWDPSKAEHHIPRSSPQIYGLDKTDGHVSNQRIELFSKRWTKQCRVVLPEKGRYIFRAETKHGEGETWATYVDDSFGELKGLPVQERWEAAYSDISGPMASERDEDDPLTVFLPTPNNGQNGEEEISWHWD